MEQSREGKIQGYIRENETPKNAVKSGSNGYASKWRTLVDKEVDNSSQHGATSKPNYTYNYVAVTHSTYLSNTCHTIIENL